MDKEDRGKFEPLTKVKPQAGASEQIDLKEEQTDVEPTYLDDKPDANPPVEPVDQPAEPTSTADYAQYPQSEKTPRSWKRPIIIVALLALVVAGAYWFLLRAEPTTETAGQSPTSSASGSSASTSATTPVETKISTTTKTYNSTNFKLAFSYPDDWVIVDAGGGVMTVKSPSLQLKNASGQTTAGQIVFTIRDKAQKLTEFDKGNATATRDSLKIVYTKPTQVQRADTYVSFLQFATTTTAGALDGIYITGNSGYKKGQAIPLVDVAKIEPNIAITFVDQNSKAMSIADSMFDTATFADPLVNIFKSLSIN